MGKSKPRGGFLWAAAALAALALLAASCRRRKDPAFSPPPINVEVAAATRGNLQETFHSLGTVEAREHVRVSAEIDAVVERLPFEEGRLVREGQTLALLRDSELRAEARRAEALRDQARLTYERLRKLAEEQVASSQDRDNAEAALKVAEANVRLAEARLAKTQIVAPLAGVVGRRLVSPGAFLKQGDVITELARIDTVKVAFEIPERYVSELKRGAKVTVTTVAYPDKNFTGAIDFVDPILDASTRSNRCVALVPNPRSELRPGMSADVGAVLADRPDAITVPNEAVFAEGDRNYLYVLRPDSTVTRRAVTLGVRQSNRVEVKEGLKQGEKVVTGGHQKLFEGAKVAATAGS